MYHQTIGAVFSSSGTLRKTAGDRAIREKAPGPILPHGPAGAPDETHAHKPCVIRAEGRLYPFCCANPLKVLLDGKTIIDCPERTVVIPAYHRADERKCAALPGHPGAYRLRVEVGDPESLTELYFMVVSDDLYCAYRLDSTFTVEEACHDHA